MNLTKEEIAHSVEEIFGLYEKYGNEDYGENVTQLMHMTQCANHAINEGASDEMVLAAFLHDIGHFLENETSMGGYGRQDHDRLGGEYLLSRGFSERMVKLVSSHVRVKRYLTFKDKTYYDELSEASRITLGFQGGPMNAEEAIAFEVDPDKDDCIKIRFWDDLGKEEHIPVDQEDLNRLRTLMTAYLEILNVQYYS
ncbi:HD domain-containing protein [Pedobacter sp.]|jgi:predicted HD phosphohydrolase|uniref:HD domain-containing protein n=1 Tax=Pedobacter sp. TaxID=1411316 RepID=UPI002BAB1480|nr:HD domain-containing protein [Pedobacter sp.]HWW40907.1 HD domain-containing protein [Pedobacter sp.]